ncbi:NAD dependent epimerase/dehydratase [Colletotrichum salicis]|uniref:NAD dependent epimerase/dehydratase n=1 Tax=Colletotrichum salicis TaxID=1209931 RepID=A0A135UAA0_9PEZI|nr:NAD dependent epimerase/dehydratase [Colletotrichum salicis]
MKLNTPGPDLLPTALCWNPTHPHQSSVDQLRKTFAFYPSTQLDFALVPDIAAPGAFDTVLVSEDAPFDVVLHTASPFNFRKGTIEILHGVVRKALSVKRVIVTSSMAAVIDITKPSISHPAKIYNESDWLGVSRDGAEASTHPAIPYVASKKFAEKAAWAFISDTEPKPAFDLVTICPPIVYGPLYDVSATKPLRAMPHLGLADPARDAAPVRRREGYCARAPVGGDDARGGREEVPGEPWERVESAAGNYVAGEAAAMGGADTEGGPGQGDAGGGYVWG